MGSKAKTATCRGRDQTGAAAPERPANLARHFLWPVTAAKSRAVSDWRIQAGACRLNLVHDAGPYGLPLPLPEDLHVERASKSVWGNVVESRKKGIIELWNAVH
jgi:hypothetical protein